MRGIVVFSHTSQMCLYTSTSSPPFWCGGAGRKLLGRSNTRVVCVIGKVVGALQHCCSVTRKELDSTIYMSGVIDGPSHGVYSSSVWKDRISMDVVYPTISKRMYSY